MFPKFVIRMASKDYTKNDTRVYYSKEGMMADLMSLWGSIDMAI